MARIAPAHLVSLVIQDLPEPRPMASLGPVYLAELFLELYPARRNRLKG
jgi:hypothetical protein